MLDTAYLLCAGVGRKFWPYAEVRNKCAFPILDEPNVLRLARQAQRLGARRIVAVVGYEQRSIRFALAGLEDVLYVEQTGAAGSSEALLAALRKHPAESDFIVLYGDLVASDSDLAALLDRHLTAEAPATALLAPLSGDRPGDWITASATSTRDDARLHGIEGHGRGGDYRIAGAFCLSLCAVRCLETQPGHMASVPVGGMPLAEADIADALAMLATSGHAPAAHIAGDPCIDLDKPWHILQATEAALRERAGRLHATVIEPGATVEEGAEICGPVYVEAGATIGNHVKMTGPCWVGRDARVLNGAIVGAGCVIGARARVSDYCLVGGGSVIGADCIVGHGAEFEGVMLPGSYIYHYSEIYGVLGAAVDIGAATVCGTLRFDDADTIHRISGRREHPRAGSNATYFGDYCRTGVNVITQPGVKIGAYSCVGPGIVLYQDVPSRKLLLLKQEVAERDWGPERYGW